MREIKTLRDDGFSLLDQDSELAGTALLSLKLALKAFFSTYQSIRDKLPFYAAENRVSDFEDSILSSSPAYCEACVETILSRWQLTISPSTSNASFYCYG